MDGSGGQGLGSDNDTAPPEGIDLAGTGLVYVTDTDPGIRRIGAGRGFYYRDTKGRRITADATIARIRALAIPPAWRDVWICADPAGHTQATGRDERGRKQYRYHPEWTSWRDAAKFSGLIAFARRLPGLRAQVDADLRRRGLTRERVLASAVRLLDMTLIRIGNDVYASENKSYGLTTLHVRHLSLTGTQLRFSFTGKSGQSWSLRLNDRRIARVIRCLQDLPGQRLFQYLDDDGARRDIHSHDVNAYIRAAMGEAFTSKHFRTWGATVRAVMALAETELPDTKRAQAVALNRVLDDVAKTLRNTRSVCRKCYVHPGVIDAWETGQLGREIATIRARAPSAPPDLAAEEAIALRWLTRHEMRARRALRASG